MQKQRIAHRPTNIINSNRIMLGTDKKIKRVQKKIKKELKGVPVRIFK